MNAILRMTVFLALTAVCGVCVVTWETPQNLLLFVIWLVVPINRIRRYRRSGSGKATILVSTAHAAVMGIIVTIAAVAPVKRIDAVLQQSVELESTQMTVAELSEYCDGNRTSLPLSISIPAVGAAVHRELHFSSTRLPLQQFISEVEQQTGRKHHFSGCGNAYSILYGSAYNFGLNFAPSSNSGNDRE